MINSFHGPPKQPICPWSRPPTAGAGRTQPVARRGNHRHGPRTRLSPHQGHDVVGLAWSGKDGSAQSLARYGRGQRVSHREGGILPQLLAPELRQVLYSLDLRAGTGHMVRRASSVLRNFASAFKVKIGEIEFGMEPASGIADTGNLEQDLPDLMVAVCEAAKERKAALGLFLDEVQYLSSEELASLIVACHEVAQRNLPMFFVGAGLPQIAALAGNAKSYAERLFNYPVVGPLDPAAARAALVNPARNESVEFQDGAVDEILRVTERYPYFIQEWGFHVWKPNPSYRRGARHSWSDCPPRHKLLPRPIRSPHSASAKVPSRYGGAGARPLPDRRNRRDTRG